MQDKLGQPDPLSKTLNPNIRYLYFQILREFLKITFAFRDVDVFPMAVFVKLNLVIHFKGYIKLFGYLIN